MSYTVDSHWNYKPDERYNSGRGLTASYDDLRNAEAVFAACSKDAYSVDLIDNDTGTVIQHFGPPTVDAIRSMHLAYKRIHPIASPVR